MKPAVKRAQQSRSLKSPIYSCHNKVKRLTFKSFCFQVVMNTNPSDCQD